MNHTTIRRLRSALLLGLGLLCLLPAPLAASPGSVKCVFWEPYAYDGDTRVLCHFDGEELVSTAEVLTLEEEEDGEPEDLMAGPAPDSEGPRTVNSVPMKDSYVPLLGDCKEVAGKGRFGGALRLKGQDGRIAARHSPGPGGWTLEAWIKVQSRPRDRATLVGLPGTAQPLRLDLLADGRLSVRWMNEKRPKTSEWRSEPGAWFHLALVWQKTKWAPSGHWQEAELRVYADGRLVLRSESQPVEMFKATLSQTATVGNDAKGRAGLDGWLDELRLSSVARQYPYSPDLNWTDTAGRRPVTSARPYFRDGQDLTLRLAFNEALDAEVNEANLEAPEFDRTTVIQDRELGRRSVALRFVDGVERQAVVLGPGQLNLCYAAKSNPVRFGQGSVAFWIRPLNWDNRTRWALTPTSGHQKVSPVFQLHSLHEGNLSPLKFGPFAQLAMVRTPDANLADPVDLHPGKWTHLCVTWGAGGRREYVNGEHRKGSGAVRFSLHPERLKAGVPLHLTFGRTETTFDFTPVVMGDSACALDDFRVYRRALAPPEVRNLAAMFDRRKAMTSLPALDLTTRYNGALGWVDVELFPLHPKAGKAGKARVSVAAKNEPKPIGEHTFELKGDNFVGGRIETPVMRFTTYEVKAMGLDAAGTELFRTSFDFSRRQPPWWKNRIGISDKVMPGWEPVAVNGRTLSVVRRDIRFSDSGLPESLIAAGEEILAAPITLAATAGGKAETLRPGADAFRAETKGEVRADFTGQSTGAGITATIRGYLEFDGFMWFTVTLSRISHPVSRISHLSLSIPYKEDASRLMHFWSGHEQFRDPRCVWSGATPTGEGVVLRSTDQKRVTLYPSIRGSFMPYVMLAGEQRGMAWFAENDQGWTQSTETPAVAIERQGDVVTLVLNIVSEPVSLAAPRRFAFGLHPIPVKELQRGWRMTPGWGVAPDVFCGFRLTGDASTVMYRHPAGMDWDAVRDRWAERKMGGPAESFAEYDRPPLDHELVKCGKYFDFQQIAAFPDDSREWAEEFWTRGYTPDVVDYTAWIWNEWVRRGFAEGMYMDDIWNRAREHTPGVSYALPDGTNQPGFPWLGPRDCLKRMRQVMVDHGLPPHFCVHSTHTLYPPYQSFFDVVLDGEDFLWRTQPDEKTFMSFWPAARLRFMNPEKWGLTITWLASSAGPNVGLQFKTYHFRQERAWTGAMLVHDLVWTLRFFGSKALLDYDWVRSSRLRFDPNTEFVGYWAARPVAPDTPKDLYVSAWKREGWCAVAIANWSTNRVDAELKLHLEAMGFEDAEVEALVIRDVDSSLLSYFDEDVTKMKAPDEEKIGEGALLDPIDTGEAGDLEAGADNEEDDLDELGFKKKVTLKGRKAADPDGKFEWKDGILKCPVRPHDFRLFEFRLPLGAPAPSRPQR